MGVQAAMEVFLVPLAALPVRTVVRRSQFLEVVEEEEAI
jgi:heme exporter protein D